MPFNPSDSMQSPGPLFRFSVFSMAAWSGVYVMALELLSSRILAPYFGNSIYVWGALTSVVMLGLAIGYLLGGLYSRNVVGLGGLTVIQLLAALSTLPTLLFAEPLLNAIFGLVADVRGGALLASTALYLLPTIFLGMVSPYSVRLLVHNTRTSGADAGTLYFVSTFGSVAGTLLTSFYLVLWFEVNTILELMLAISIAMICLTLAIRRWINRV